MTRSISELALATIDELDRRGWTKGELARMKWVKDWKALENGFAWDYASEEDCKVCLVGAMSSAYNPYHPTVPGYNVSDLDGDGRQDVVDPEYQKFINAVIAEVPADSLEGDAYYDTTYRAITNFNDDYAEDVEDVKELLRRVAEKHS